MTATTIYSVSFISDNKDKARPYNVIVTQGCSLSESVSEEISERVSEIFFMA